jgi:hypothetical protein
MNTANAAEMTEIESLILNAAKRSYPQPLNARMAQNYSRKLKNTPVSEVREAFQALSVHGHGRIEGEGNAIAFACESLPDDEFDSDESELPEPRTKLEWKKWNLRREEDREELLD